MWKTGVIGCGFVGKAVVASFSSRLEPGDYKICVFDPKINNDADGYYSSAADVVSECNVNFVCVPTPTDFKKGRQDLTILDQVMAEVAPVARKTGNVVVIKSTIAPGTMDRYDKEFPGVSLVHNPEFLTEANYIKDFKNQKTVILGSHDNTAAASVAELYEAARIGERFSIVGPLEAEFAKYGTNTFLATKVAFFNELAVLCEKAGASFDSVREMIAADDRIGHGHTLVPGPDGLKGFGGKCFPKDMLALIEASREHNAPCRILWAAWQTNLRAREKQDWLEIEGASS